ncbi:MAG: hypothetical protein ACYDBV_12430 [Nitrospiria bacterium]
MRTERNYNAMQLFRDFREFYQRGKRGYSDSDLHDFDTYLISIIVPGLKWLKENMTGCPSDLYDKEAVDNEWHLWHETLDEMIAGFEASDYLTSQKYLKKTRNEKGNTFYVDHKDMEAKYLVMQKGLDLFSKYFINLWE